MDKCLSIYITIAKLIYNFRYSDPFKTKFAGMIYSRLVSIDPLGFLMRSSNMFMAIRPILTASRST